MRPIFAIAFALCACATPRAFSRRDDTAIRAVLLSQQSAWNRADLDAFMAGYARTAAIVFTSGGKIRRGWQETFDRYRSRYGGDRASMGRLEFAILGIQPLGADGAIVLGRWQLTETAQSGAGVFTLAFERRPEGWRIVHDHTSAD